MKKRMLALALALLMTMVSMAALADGYAAGLASLPENAQQIAEEAVMAQLPQATIHYSILERDDGRLEWEVYFLNNGALGMCEVDAQTGEILRTREYADTPADALTADAAIAALRQAKGDAVILELDLDRDDGRLRYEGEAELGGRLYEFEMTVSGKIIEWERD